MINYNLTMAPAPNATPNQFLPLTLNNIYLRDHKTGLLSLSSSLNPGPTAFTNQDSTNCLCDNVLEEATFNFLLNNSTKALTKISVDLILGKNIVSKCTNNYVISQTYSVNFLHDLQYNYKRSGNPGYEVDSNLNCL
jgi:hypothetical protein